MKYETVEAVKIHLAFAALWAARIRLVLDGKLGVFKVFGFTGPDFQPRRPGDTVEVAIGHSTVNVIVNEDIEYIYSLHSVGRIKITG